MKENSMMNKDQVAGKVKEVEGRVQAAVGALRDDPEAEAEGKVKAVEGQAQQVVGNVKKALHDAIG